MNNNNNNSCVIHISSNQIIQGEKHFTVTRKAELYQIYSYRITMKKPIFKTADSTDKIEDCFIEKAGEETFQKICQDLNIQWTKKVKKFYATFYNFDKEDYEKLYFYIKIIGEQIAWIN